MLLNIPENFSLMTDFSFISMHLSKIMDNYSNSAGKFLLIVFFINGLIYILTVKFSVDMLMTSIL